VPAWVGLWSRIVVVAVCLLWLSLESIFNRFAELLSHCQVKMPFEKLLHALRNFPEEATDPDVLLPLAISFKVKYLIANSLVFDMLFLRTLAVRGKLMCISIYLFISLPW
jgi:hypothetical protein